MTKHSVTPQGTSTATTDSPLIVSDDRPSDSVVELWFRETFYNRAISPDETNRLIAAKDRLKALLRGVKE